MTPLETIVLSVKGGRFAKCCFAGRYGNDNSCNMDLPLIDKKLLLFCFCLRLDLHCTKKSILKHLNRITMKKLSLIAGIIMLTLSIAVAQDGLNQRIPLIGSPAPSFKAASTHGEINFPKDYGDSWKIIFSHPRNYTPVCSSEILELAFQQDEFDRLGAKLIVLSTDKLDRHISWKSSLEEVSLKGKGNVIINFPLVEDHTYRISNLYGMLDSETNVGQNIRGVFFIDPQNKIRAFYFYPNEVGRNVEEIKRTLVALQHSHADKRAALPVNWQAGDDYMVMYLTEEEKAELGKQSSNIYQPTWFMNYKKNNAISK